MRTSRYLEYTKIKKVITYGTYDLLHQGHINLLRRAKELGDYLIVGVTSDSFDRGRGKLNVRNNVLERVEAVKATGYADKVIIEEYMGQKIDDIQRYNVEIFAIGSDWEGQFDYLNEYAKVVYLPRTEGISGIMTYLNGAVSFLAINMVGNLPLPINIVVCYFNAFIASLGILLLCSQIKKEYKQTRQLAMSLISIVGLQEIFFVSWLNITGGSNSLLLNVTVAIMIMLLCYLLHKFLLLYLSWAVGVIKKKK